MVWIWHRLPLLPAFWCPNGLDMAPVAAFTCFLVPLALKLLHLKPIFEMYILNVVFAAIASIAGSMLDAYAIPYFDKVLHFCSGF